MPRRKHPLESRFSVFVGELSFLDEPLLLRVWNHFLKGASSSFRKTLGAGCGSRGSRLRPARAS